jgi:hypothetical protein
MAGSTCGGAGRRTKGEPAMFLSGTGSEFGTGGTRWEPVVEVFAGVEEPLATANLREGRF